MPKLIHNAYGVPSVSPQASHAAQLSWVVHVASTLDLIDHALLSLWWEGECTDLDLLHNIQAHGGWPTERDHAPLRAQAGILSERINNLLQAALFTDGGNL
jgi:hypothetical protein